MGPEPDDALRVRGRIAAIADVLAEHGAYFDLSARMRFAEIDLFGVYVAPLSLNLVGAWFVTIALRRVAGRLGAAATRLASGSVRFAVTSSFSRPGS